MAERSAGHGDFAQDRGPEGRPIELASTIPHSAFEGESENIQSAFDRESEVTQSAFYNESENTQPAFDSESETIQARAHDDVMLHREDTTVDSQEVIAWRSAGRPSCQQCLKSHPPPCRASQEDTDFCQRDPEGYKLHLKSKQTRRKKQPRSNRRPEPPGYNTSRISRPVSRHVSRPELTQTQRLYTLAAYNNAQAGQLVGRQLALAESNPSPQLTAYMRHVAMGTHNDPAQVTDIRELLAVTQDDGLSTNRRNIHRAFSRVFEDTLSQLAAGTLTAEQQLEQQPEPTQE